MYIYDKDEIKKNLTIDQVKDLVDELGGEAIEQNSVLHCRTICHCGNSHKLYYYDNTKLFKCFTDCGETFDIFQLIQKIMQSTLNVKWELPQCTKFVADYFKISPTSQDFFSNQEKLKDWKIFDNYISKQEVRKVKVVEMPCYDGKFLENMPSPVIIPWLKDGISIEVAKNSGIKYNPINSSIVIPHYDINNNLVGIRERTMIEENEKYGKYRPGIYMGKMYNHPLGFNLYYINKAAPAIKKIKKAIILEGEKSPLQYASIYGEDNCIAVASCGSSITSYQVKILLSLGVEEIIIGMDRQFQETGDNEWKKLTKNLINIHNKFGAYVQISYLFDKNKITPYKASPLDCGQEIFEELVKERIVL